MQPSRHGSSADTDWVLRGAGLCLTQNSNSPEMTGTVPDLRREITDEARMNTHNFKGIVREEV